METRSCLHRQASRTTVKDGNTNDSGEGGLDCRVSSRPDVGGWYKTLLRVGPTSNPCPSIALVCLYHIKLFAVVHWDRAFTWSCNHMHQNESIWKKIKFFKQLSLQKSSVVTEANTARTVNIKQTFENLKYSTICKFFDL